jgi:hypothetical protein
MSSSKKIAPKRQKTSPKMSAFSPNPVTPTPIQDGLSSHLFFVRFRREQKMREKVVCRRLTREQGIIRRKERTRPFYSARSRLGLASRNVYQVTPESDCSMEVLCGRGGASQISTVFLFIVLPPHGEPLWLSGKVVKMRK